MYFFRNPNGRSDNIEFKIELKDKSKIEKYINTEHCILSVSIDGGKEFTDKFDWNNSDECLITIPWRYFRASCPGMDVNCTIIIKNGESILIAKFSNKIRIPQLRVLPRIEGNVSLSRVTLHMYLEASDRLKAYIDNNDNTRFCVEILFEYIKCTIITSDEKVITDCKQNGDGRRMEHSWKISKIDFQNKQAKWSLDIPPECRGSVLDCGYRWSIKNGENNICSVNDWCRLGNVSLCEECNGCKYFACPLEQNWKVRKGSPEYGVYYCEKCQMKKGYIGRCDRQTLNKFNFWHQKIKIKSAR